MGESRVCTFRGMRGWEGGAQNCGKGVKEQASNNPQASVAWNSAPCKEGHG